MRQVRVVMAVCLFRRSSRRRALIPLAAVHSRQGHLWALPPACLCPPMATWSSTAPCPVVRRTRMVCRSLPELWPCLHAKPPPIPSERPRGWHLRALLLAAVAGAWAPRPSAAPRRRRHLARWRRRSRGKRRAHLPFPRRRRRHPLSPLCFRRGCPQPRSRWAMQVVGLARAQGRCRVRVAGHRSRTSRMVPALQHHGAWLVQARSAWLCGDRRWHRVRPTFAGPSSLNSVGLASSE